MKKIVTKQYPAYISLLLFILAASLAGLYVSERNKNQDLSAQLLDKSNQLIALNVATDASNGAPAAANATKVDLSTSTVIPGDITISKGATVTWRNGDYADYTLQTLPGAPEAFKSKTLSVGQSFSYKFDKPGVYKYFVVQKADRMTGTITVNE